VQQEEQVRENRKQLEQTVETNWM